MTKKVAWRDAVALLERGDPEVLANTFSFPLPDKVEEQTEMLGRLMPLLTVTAAAKSRPKATLVVSMLLQKIGAKPEAEAALVGLYEMDAKGDARLVTAQGIAAAALLSIASKSALATLTKRLDTVLATTDEVEAARQFVDWK